MNRARVIGGWIILATLWLPLSGVGAAARPGSPIRVTLPSAEASGIAVNDQIPLLFFPAAGTAGKPAPALIMLHPLGSDKSQPLMLRFAKRLSGEGINCALMDLPYHGERIPPGEQGGSRFTDEDLSRVVQAYGQSASDVSTLVTWLGQQPSVDPHRIGIVGVSLGAIITHLAMGKDDRLVAGVAILGGGDLADLRRHSLVHGRKRHHYVGKKEPDAAEQLRPIEPLTYADKNRPRHVLMIEAARDLLVLPRDATELWEALGRPPIQWIDTNHFALAIAPDSAFRAAREYLKSVWEGEPGRPIPTVRAPTIKVGNVIGMGSLIDPTLQWQAYSFASRRDHMSLVHADLGLNFRGPFLGLAFTVNPFIDLGMAHRFLGRGVQPYASIHIVF